MEAKFGKSQLTVAQRALKGQMGDAFTVSRTTAAEVGEAAGHAGAVVVGSASTAVAHRIKR